MSQMTIYRCAFCGEFIPEGRSDKRYHSDACKQKAYRWRKRQQRYASDARVAISNLISYLSYEETRQSTVEELGKLMSYIPDVARQYNVVIKAAR